MTHLFKSFLLLTTHLSVWNWIYFATLFPWMKVCVFFKMLQSEFECAASQSQKEKIMWMWTCFHFISQSALYRRLHASHISQVEWGVHTKTSTWYLDQGQNQITFNYKHPYNSFLSISVTAEVCYRAGRSWQTNRRLLSLPQKLFLCILSCLSPSPTPLAAVLQADGLKCFLMFLWSGLCHMSHSALCFHTLFV